MRRELLLLREMRDAALAIRDLVGVRTADQVEADTDMGSGSVPVRGLGMSTRREIAPRGVHPNEVGAYARGVSPWRSS
jgi:hypothetical protein